MIKLSNRSSVSDKGKWWVLGVLFLFLLQLSLLLIIYSSARKSQDIRGYVICLGLLMLTLLINVLLVILRIVRRKKAALQERLEECRFSEQMERKRKLTEAEMQKDAIQLKIRLRQELEDAKAAVRSLEQGVVGRSVEDVLEQVRDPWDFGFCANAIVNAVLKEKYSECRKLKIQFEAETEVPPQIRVTDYHLCSIFSNLLDNAIEASLVLPEKERRIEVQSAIRGNYMCIRVKNTCSIEYVRRPPRDGRGLGTGIISSIAAQYDGEVTVNVTEGIQDKAGEGRGGYLADVVLRIR